MLGGEDEDGVIISLWMEMMKPTLCTAFITVFLAFLPGKE